MMTEKRKQIDEVLKELVLSHAKIVEVSGKLMTEMKRGLAKATNAEASVKMFPTYVRHLPTGKECGKFLALDLGGTNFRVLYIELDAGKVHMESKIFAIPQQIMLGTGEELFDHIADCLARFIEDFKLKGEHLPLGFTFSFPCKQEGLTSARLVTWTKGFSCSGVENKDVVVLLREALKRRSHIKIDVVALVNDTTGTLMSCAYKNPSCRVGVIVGTGTNACYTESLENVEIWDEDRDEPKEVIVNTEWGAFGSQGELDFLRTEYDRIIDRNSLNAGKQIYEKMISGMYMGELVRLVLLKLVEKKLLFGGKASLLLEGKERFYTKYVSEIESEPGLNNTKQVLEELGINNPTNEDCEIVKNVCEIVSTRAAHLTAAGIATLLIRVNKPFVTVGIDGSVYRFHPHFSRTMSKKIGELLPPHLDFQQMLSEDGSGKGAALVAAVAVRNRNDVANLVLKELAAEAPEPIIQATNVRDSNFVVVAATP